MTAQRQFVEDRAVVHQPRPIYVIVCNIEGGVDDKYEPVLRDVAPGLDDPETTFDPKLVPILPAIWYALHLPATRFDVLDMPLQGIRESLHEKRRHLILPVPAYVVQHPVLLRALSRLGELTLMISDDESFEIASKASRETHFVLPAIRVSDLSATTLQGHWGMLSDRWSASWPAGVEVDRQLPSWSPSIASNGSALSLRRLLRSLGRGDVTVQCEEQAPLDGVFKLLRWRSFLNALSDLEARGLTITEAEPLLDAEIAKAARRLKVPLTLSLPGVAPRYRRLVSQRARDTIASIPDGTDGPGAVALSSSVRQKGDPPDVLRLLVAHNAAGDNSAGFVSDTPIPDEAFIALANLERYWVDSSRSMKGVQPEKEARLRARLDDAMQPFWSDQMVEAIQSASQIDAFTNFPIGLLRMPGHSSPLAALLPIAYRPLNPLTRALQLEFSPDTAADISGGMRVLVVECIPDTDPVGVISRNAWSFAAQELTDPDRSVFVDLVDAANVDDVAKLVADHRPDVLIVSAHGVYDSDSNMAGLAIGSGVSMGDDIGPMPPVVILSACHSGPRGAGPVAVADLLLRAGARAVLSTLVPVGVLHNSTFMTRLLVYMSESIGGSEAHVTLLDLWHRVQTNTVILDVLYGNPKLLEWGYSDENGTPPVVEFMGTRSVGRLRTSHLYEDTEAVLLEIAEDRGEKDAVQRWLRTPGYVPESMMYTIVGDPSSIRFRASSLTSAQRAEPRGRRVPPSARRATKRLNPSRKKRK